jgi:hypothetical protein
VSNSLAATNNLRTDSTRKKIDVRHTNIYAWIDTNAYIQWHDNKHNVPGKKYINYHPTKIAMADIRVRCMPRMINLLSLTYCTPPLPVRARRPNKAHQHRSVGRSPHGQIPFQGARDQTDAARPGCPCARNCCKALIQWKPVVMETSLCMCVSQLNFRKTPPHPPGQAQQFTADMKYSSRTPIRLHFHINIRTCERPFPRCCSWRST